MSTIFDPPAARRARKEEIRDRESRFSIATVVLVFAVAACAMVATVQAYGPVFLAPVNGP